MSPSDVQTKILLYLFEIQPNPNIQLTPNMIGIEIENRELMKTFLELYKYGYISGKIQTYEDGDKELQFIKITQSGTNFLNEKDLI
jgi:hypothetical protein